MYEILLRRTLDIQLIYVLTVPYVFAQCGAGSPRDLAFIDDGVFLFEANCGKHRGPPV